LLSCWVVERGLLSLCTSSPLRLNYSLFIIHCSLSLGIVAFYLIIHTNNQTQQPLLPHCFYISATFIQYVLFREISFRSDLFWLDSRNADFTYHYWGSGIPIYQTSKYPRFNRVICFILDKLKFSRFQ
jgi:hypothetical protein